MTALLSRKTLIASFGLTLEEIASGLLDRLRLVQIAGARHGRAGYYPDGDFSSDADWCYGIGAEINALEVALDIDDDSVMDLYTDAHGAFFRDGTINPGERNDHRSCFTFHFGAYGCTKCSVWATHLEDALEMAAEWLLAHAPGLFIEPEYDVAAKELGLPDSWRQDEDMCEQVQCAAEVDLTYTESGYLASWEISFSEDDHAPGPPSKRK